VTDGSRNEEPRRSLSPGLLVAVTLGAVLLAGACSQEGPGVTEEGRHAWSVRLPDAAPVEVRALLYRASPATDQAFERCVANKREHLLSLAEGLARARDHGGPRAEELHRSSFDLIHLVSDRYFDYAERDANGNPTLLLVAIPPDEKPTYALFIYRYQAGNGAVADTALLLYTDAAAEAEQLVEAAHLVRERLDASLAGVDPLPVIDEDVLKEEGEPSEAARYLRDQTILPHPDLSSMPGYGGP
jgi:hypothetical protein